MFTYHKEPHRIVSELLLEIIMVKALSKVFFVTAMLIAFIGQAMTFNTLTSFENACKDFPDFNISNDNNKNINKDDQPKTDSEAIDDCCDVECCDINCACSATACTTLMYLKSDIGANQIVSFNEPIPLPQSEQPNSITSLPYRPPIITS